MEGFAVPTGGLSGFLHDNLRFKVFLVSIAVFDDRWATRARDTLRAQELHEIRVCVRIIIDHVVCHPLLGEELVSELALCIVLRGAPAAERTAL
jgi:hypothetical protein